MKRLFSLAGLCLMGIVSCATQPGPQAEKTVPAGQAPVILESPADPVPESPPEEPAPFDYSNITEEVRTHTRAEVQQLIGELNGIIEKEDYQAWINSLDPSYLEKISSKQFLAEQSQSPRLKSQESLKNVKEYFEKVVVPSRTNADYRMEDIDIQFIPEEKKVLAFLTTPAGRRLRLYELKNVDGIWKIAN
jgi:hypothetical protein